MKAVTIFIYPTAVKGDIFLKSDQARVLKCLPIYFTKSDFPMTQFQFVNNLRSGTFQQLGDFIPSTVSFTGNEKRLSSPMEAGEHIFFLFSTNL